MTKSEDLPVIDLKTLTREGLEEAIQLYVVGSPAQHRWIETSGSDMCYHCGLESWQDDKPCKIHYTHNINEVIPLLGQDYDIRVRNGMFMVTLYQPSEQYDGFCNHNMGWAAGIALLRRAHAKVKTLS